MKKIPLTVVVLTYNEQKNIEECLNSASFADEILVIDGGSKDETQAIAKKLGAKVLFHELNNDYSAQRNFGIENAKNEWIFMLDADERITDKLAKEIAKCIENNLDETYRVSRENHFVEGKCLHGTLRPDYVERLFKKTGSCYEGIIHERLKTPYSLKKLKGRLIHFPYYDYESHLNKLNKYTTLLAKKYHEKGKKCSFVRDILIKPSFAFFKMYVIHGGFLDGKLGLQFCLLHYFYTLEKYLKLYSLNKHNGRI